MDQNLLSDESKQQVDKELASELSSSLKLSRDDTEERHTSDGAEGAAGDPLISEGKTFVDAVVDGSPCDEETEPEVDYDTDEEKKIEVEKDMSNEEKQIRKEAALQLKTTGNEHFKAENFEEALKAYKQALHLCPLEHTNERAIIYSNRAACLQHLQENDDAIVACSKALDLNPTYVKARLRRAKLYETTDKLDEALQDFTKILETDPSNRDAFFAAQELPGRINERNEKLKEEMLGKLKDLGNLVLRPFGLSTDNFKLQQDPTSGSYSVNFQQNTK